MDSLSESSDDSNSNAVLPVKILNEPTVEEVDRIFIRKAVEFIRTLPGANSDDIKVQTNTSFPSRYVLMVSNLPKMKISDFESLRTLAPRLRGIKLSMKDNWLKMDVWKHGANIRKSKRKLAFNEKREWNLKTIGKQDHGMLKRILNGFSNLASFPCQFHVDVVNQPPNYYYLDITSNDIIDLADVDHFKHDFRAFVKDVQFNFSIGSLRLFVERASASTEAAVGKRRRVVFKSN